MLTGMPGLHSDAEAGISNRAGPDADVRPKRSAMNVVYCQVAGCGRDLKDEKDYYRRYKVCLKHASSPMVMLRGIPQRFCQQCGTFHPIGEFDADKRSCRHALSLHNLKRRKKGPDGRYINPPAHMRKPAITSRWQEPPGPPEMPDRMLQGGPRPRSGAHSSGGGAGSIATRSLDSMGAGCAVPRPRIYSRSLSTTEEAAAAVEHLHEEWRRTAGMHGLSGLSGPMPSWPGAIPAANAAALMGDTAASARASRSLPNVPAGFNWLALGQGLAPPEQLLSLQEAWARTDEAQRVAAEQMLAAHLAYGQGFDAGRQGSGGAMLDALAADGGAGEHTARAFQLLQALHPAGASAAHPMGGAQALDSAMAAAAAATNAAAAVRRDFRAASTPSWPPSSADSLAVMQLAALQQAHQQRLSVGSTPGLNSSFSNGFGQLPGSFAAPMCGAGGDPLAYAGASAAGFRRHPAPGSRSESPEGMEPERPHVPTPEVPFAGAWASRSPPRPTDRLLGPRGGGVGGTPSRAGLPRTLSQEALREVAASLTLMTNVTDNPNRSSAFRPYKLPSSSVERAGSGGVKRDYAASAPISPRRRSSEDVPMAGDQGGKVGGLQRAETSGPQLGSMILDPRPSAAERPR